MPGLDWNSVTPAVQAQHVNRYFELPAFNLAAPAWKNSSEIARQYNYSATKNFALRNRPAKPSGVNYGLCIRYRIGDVVTRYKLWDDNAFLLPNVPLYNGETIKKHFCLEIWSLNGQANISQASSIRLTSTIRKYITDFSAMPANDEDDAGEAAASLSNAASASAPPAAGLEAWYKAAEANVVLDGSDNVQQWNDLSGKGRHLVQATPANRPAWLDNGFGTRNHPRIRFSGANDNLALNPLPASFSPKHLYLALYQPAWTIGASIFFSVRTLIRQFGAAGDVQSVTDGVTATVSLPVVAGSAANEDTPRILEWYYTSVTGGLAHKGTLVENSLFKTLESATDAVETDLVASTAIQFGSGAEFDIAEALIYSEKQSAANDLLIKQYLANQFVLGIALPVSFDSGSPWLTN